MSVFSHGVESRGIRHDMAQPTPTPTNRLERRKARTRAALVHAAQAFIGAGNPNVPILEITQAADVGLGSFYNHFESKEELFEAAVEEVMETLGSLLDRVTPGVDDPAQVFSQSFRIVGRWHRRNPDMSRVLLANGFALVGSDRGLAPRALRDIEVGVRAGRFTVRDPELAFTLIAGASLCLGQFLHDHPERDDAEAVDQVAEDLLRVLGLTPKQAQRIAHLPLPDVDEVPQQDSAAAPGRPARAPAARAR
jgi:AcrR family transcriptional regulator